MDDELAYRTPSFRDTLAAAQLMAERQLTGMLISMPVLILSTTDPWLPDVGKREREFWRKARLLDVNSPDFPDLFFQVIAEGDYWSDILDQWRWEEPLNSNSDSFFHPFAGVNEDYIKGKLLEVRTLQAARRGMEILSKRPELVDLGVCHV